MEEKVIEKVRKTYRWGRNHTKHRIKKSFKLYLQHLLPSPRFLTNPMYKENVNLAEGEDKKKSIEMRKIHKEKRGTEQTSIKFIIK